MENYLGKDYKEIIKENMRIFDKLNRNFERRCGLKHIQLLYPVSDGLRLCDGDIDMYIKKELEKLFELFEDWDRAYGHFYLKTSTLQIFIPHGNRFGGNFHSAHITDEVSILTNIISICESHMYKELNKEN